ncbi:TITAN-like protein [Zea mays]|nr:TITAN-like protein [Zea mays]
MLSANWFHSSGPATKGHQSTVLVNDTRQLISCTDHAQANVHTGAPPRLKANGHDLKNLSLRSCGLPSRKGNLRKLNPKRVGAAWAEKRRAELEMEKEGEIVPITSDSSWLPNFGSVWQSGTRKESRKEFEKNHKFHDTKSNMTYPWR